MTEWTDLALYGALFLTGLAGSLHCLGMCGPLLLSFASLLDQPGRPNRRLDFWAYHTGRIWTYGLLGFLVGGAVSSTGHVLPLGWQPPFAVLLGVLVLIVGLASLGWLPGWRSSRFELQASKSCAMAVRSGWLAPWLTHRSVAARLILGAIMGLLPCGLVYSALLVAATLPSPLQSALGMMAFGIGTAPTLGALLLSRRLIPVSWRGQGTRLTAALMIGMGLFILFRATWMNGHGMH